jgi:hypothetical protein
MKGGFIMLGFLITIENNDGKEIIKITEYPNDRISILNRVCP